MGELFTPTHLGVLAIVALVVFGGRRLPELGKGLGEGFRGFRDGIMGVKDGLKEVAKVTEAPEPE